MFPITLRCILVLVFASGVGLVSAAQGNVLVVGPGGFPQIQGAVQAAQDGDTILVRIPAGSFTFNAVEVAGKALTIVADSNSQLVSVQSVYVHDVPAGKTVVLSRLSATGGGSAPAALRLVNNAGSARLVACNSRGRAGGFSTFSPPATPAMRVTSSSGSTAFAACELIGGHGGHTDEYPALPGAAGLELQDATLASFDTTVTGGEGGPLITILDEAGAGGPGATVVHSASPTRLLLSNSSIQGGQGGEVSWCYPGYSGIYFSGPGGTGLVRGAGTTVVQHQTTLVGGPPGDLGVPCGAYGPEGEPLFNDGGPLDVNPTTALRLTTPTVAREGQTITLTFTGVQGDRVTLLAGLQTIFRETMGGVLLVDSGYPAFPTRGPLGTIGPSGVLTVDYTLPSLPAGVEAVNVFFQGLARHADGKRTLGSFSVLTLLDSAF